MNKFNIGDKVRVKDFQAVKDDFSLPDMGDSELVVVGVNDDKLSVMPICSTPANCYFIVDADVFELVEQTDKKTDFLSELKALLEKYAMEIGTYNTQDEHFPCGIRIGSRYQQDDYIQLFYDMPIVTAEDIMDYDKD